MLKALLLSIRLKTLTAAFVPVLVGTALVYALSKSFSLSIFALCLGAALFIQIATNLFNDAKDFQKGADSAGRLGPLRVTQSGLFSYKQVMTLAAICLFLAMLLGIPLVIKGGLPIMVLGLVSLFLAYGYTAGPLPLAYIGLGDLFVYLFFGVFAVGGVYYLNELSYSLSAFMAGSQIGLLTTVLIVINNLRDYEQDRKVKKMTLAARFGYKFSIAEVSLLYVLSYGHLVYWLFTGFKAAAMLPLLSLPLAISLVSKLKKTKPSAKYNSYLAQSSKIFLIYSILFITGLVIDVTT